MIKNVPDIVCISQAMKQSSLIKNKCDLLADFLTVQGDSITSERSTLFFSLRKNNRHCCFYNDSDSYYRNAGFREIAVQKDSWGKCYYRHKYQTPKVRYVFFVVFIIAHNLTKFPLISQFEIQNFSYVETANFCALVEHIFNAMEEASPNTHTSQQHSHKAKQSD